MTPAEIAACYDRVVRRPREGTIGAAVTEHAQACGLVGYVLGMHPDAVARVVGRRDAMRGAA